MFHAGGVLMKNYAVLWAGLALVGCLGSPAKAQIFVSDFNNGSGQQVRRFDDTGVPIPPIPFLDSGGGGAEGLSCRLAGGVPELFVANNTGRINVYNKATGALLRTFTIAGAQTIAAISLSLDAQFLYVADYGSQMIDKVNASSGDLSGTLVVTPVKSIVTPASHDLVVGPDNFIYATGFNLNTGVQRFDADLTPGSLTQFIPNGDNGLSNPAGLAFVGKTLYVSNFSPTNGRVNVYGDPSGLSPVPTNTFIATIPFPNNSRPLGMAGRADGSVLVAEFGADAVALITRTGNTFTLNAQFIPTPVAGPNPKYVSNPDTCRVPGGGTCSTNPLQLLTGTWTFSTDGFIGLQPFASAGSFTASLGTRGGNQIGILTITTTTSQNGQIVRLETDAGTYQINADCSGGTLTFNLSSRPLTFDFWFTQDGNQIRLVSSLAGITLRGNATRGGTTCPANPLQTLSGRWVFSMEGFAPSPQQPFASAGQFLASIGTRGGSPIGLLTITQTSDLSGSITSQETDTGTFQIFPDCSGGSLTFNLSSRPLTFDFWFKNGGTAIRFVSTTPGTIVHGTAAP
jgi:hypothetical protein